MEVWGGEVWGGVWGGEVWGGEVCGERRVDTVWWRWPPAGRVPCDPVPCDPGPPYLPSGIRASCRPLTAPYAVQGGVQAVMWR